MPREAIAAAGFKTSREAAVTVVVDVRLNHYRSMCFDLRCGNSRSKGPCNRIWFAQACRINSSFAALTKSLTNDGGRNENSSSPFIWRPITALDKKRRQPKQTAVIPIAIFHSNIDVRKEFKRITGSSRGKVKPLLPDNPYYSTNPHKSFNTQSFANNSDWGNLSPPFFGRGLYAPSTRSSKETAKGHSTDLTYNFD